MLIGVDNYIDAIKDIKEQMEEKVEDELDLYNPNKEIDYIKEVN